MYQPTGENSGSVSSFMNLWDSSDPSLIPELWATASYGKQLPQAWFPSLLQPVYTSQFSSVQFSSVTQSCPTLWDPMNRSTPGLPVHHQLLEFTQTHIHWVGDTIQPSPPLLSPSPPTFNLSQHQGLFKWVSFLHQVVKVWEFQLQHHSFQWTLGTDFL